MSDDDDFESGDDNGVAGLRKAHKELKKQNEQLLAELGQYRAQQRQSSVASILEARGLPASAAKLYNGDDTSEDAVGKWIDEYADVFGARQQAPADDQNAASVRRVAQAAHGGSQPEIGKDTNGKPILGDPAEIMHAIQTLPMEELQRLGYMPKTGTLFNPAR